MRRMTGTGFQRARDGGVPTEQDGDLAWIACIVDSMCRADPTPAEIEQIRRYVRWVVRRVYREDVAERVLPQPFAAVGGHNTVRLWKIGTGDWNCRRATWTVGSYPPVELRPMSLERLLDEMARGTEYRTEAA